MASSNSGGSSAPIVYGGDEVSAIVVDLGSAFTRVGFAGDDTPKVALPSLYGKRKNANYDPELMTDADSEAKNDEYDYFFGSNTLNRPIKDVELKQPVNEGLVDDWEGTRLICEYAFSAMNIEDDLTEHPLLMTEQIWSTDEHRTKAMELAFETWNVPAFYMVKSPVASLFSCGKGSGLVVDIGADITTVTPVVDGLALFKTSRRSKRAGRYLDKQILQLFNKRNITVNPWYKVANKQSVGLGEPAVFEERTYDYPIPNLYHDLQVSRVVKEYRDNITRVSPSPLTDDIPPEVTAKILEFPDGSQYEFSPREQYEVTEGLFRPRDYPLDGEEFPPIEEDVDTEKSTNKPDEQMDDKSDDKSNEKKDEKKDSDEGKQLTDKEITDQLVLTDRTTADFSSKGISDLIVEAINACDVDIIPNLANNIVVVGGGSLLTGMTDRINQDLTEALSGLKIRIYAPGNSVERRFSSWVGGSILASLGTFHQLWISKKEYEEVGVSKLLEKRFR